MGDRPLLFSVCFLEISWQLSADKHSLGTLCHERCLKGSHGLGSQPASGHAPSLLHLPPSSSSATLTFFSELGCSPVAWSCVCTKVALWSKTLQQLSPELIMGNASSPTASEDVRISTTGTLALFVKKERKKKRCRNFQQKHLNSTEHALKTLKSSRVKNWFL